MLKKYISIFMVMIISVSFLFGCGKKEEDNKIKVGISFATNEDIEANQDGNYLKSILNRSGYEAELRFAGNDVDTQIEDIGEMIKSGCKAIVINPIDDESLVNVLSTANNQGITVISYKNLIKNSSAVSYYVKFDKSSIGYMQAQYIVDGLKLDKSNIAYNIEIFSGDVDDSEAKAYYKQAMEVLRPYIEAGKLNVLSGEIDYYDVITAPADSETKDENGEIIDDAHTRMVRILNEYYSEENILDAVYCPMDYITEDVVYGVDYNYNGNYPITTGYGCSLKSARYIATNKQSMSIFMNSRLLAGKTMNILKHVLEGEELSLEGTYVENNGLTDVTVFECQPVLVENNNYEEILVGSGYYSMSQLYD